jgi:hypothetical protein
MREIFISRFFVFFLSRIFAFKKTKQRSRKAAVLFLGDNFCWFFDCVFDLYG